jgi:RNA polymerase sigma-70 factor, ECF subfamily
MKPPRPAAGTSNRGNDRLNRSEGAINGSADWSATVELVRRCLDGDESGWRAFVDQFQQPVFALCLRMLRHRQDAEDVAQETLVRVIRNLDRWDRERPLLPWLLTITANRCRTALERRRRQPVWSGLLSEPEGSCPGAGGGELAEELTLALDELRSEYRECFVLFYQAELGCAEISQIMDCPVGTVKTWLFRARAQVAERLRRRGIHSEMSNELQ